MTRRLLCAKTTSYIAEVVSEEVVGALTPVFATVAQTLRW